MRLAEGAAQGLVRAGEGRFNSHFNSLIYGLGFPTAGVLYNSTEWRREGSGAWMSRFLRTWRPRHRACTLDPHSAPAPA